MDFKQIALELLARQLGGRVDDEAVKSGLHAVFSGAGGASDLRGLLNKFTALGSMRGVVDSWLGDGANEEITAAQIESALGADTIRGFASHLGIGETEAANELAELIPRLIDKVSQGGALLDGTGDAGSLIDMAKKFL